MQTTLTDESVSSFDCKIEGKASFQAPCGGFEFRLNGLPGGEQRRPSVPGEGPCREHPTVSSEFNPRTWDLLWGGNSSCRYAECRECGLRLGYWPKLGASMTHLRFDSPHHVRMALTMLNTEVSSQFVLPDCVGRAPGQERGISAAQSSQDQLPTEILSCGKPRRSPRVGGTLAESHC